MKNVVASLLTLGVLVASSPLYAGGESGIYFGAGLGQGTIKDDGDIPDGGDFDFDGSDFAYKFILGYNFGLVPLVDLAVEGSYVNFGKPDDSANGAKLEYELTGWDAFGLVGANLGPIGIFGKAGLIAWDTDTKIDGTSGGSSGTDAAWGIGLRAQLFSVTGRLEFEGFDIGDVDDAYMVSGSVLVTF